MNPAFLKEYHRPVRGENVFSGHSASWEQLRHAPIFDSSPSGSGVRFGCDRASTPVAAVSLKRFHGPKEA